MSNIFTGAGTVFAVSSALPDEFSDDATDGYPSLTFTTVGEVTGIPLFGAEYTPITHLPLAERVVVKRKGSVNYGAMTLPLALDPDDAGQIILRDHADGDNEDDSVACELTYSNGHIRYFTAQVMSFQEGVDSSDAITNANVALEIDRAVVRVEPEE